MSKEKVKENSEITCPTVFQAAHKWLLLAGEGGHFCHQPRDSQLSNKLQNVQHHLLHHDRNKAAKGTAKQQIVIGMLFHSSWKLIDCLKAAVLSRNPDHAGREAQTNGQVAHSFLWPSGRALLPNNGYTQISAVLGPGCYLSSIPYNENAH